MYQVYKEGRKKKLLAYEPAIRTITRLDIHEPGANTDTEQNKTQQQNTTRPQAREHKTPRLHQDQA